MNRRPLVSGNWKLNKNHHEALHLVRDLGLRLRSMEIGPVEVSVHPPFTDLRTIQSLVEGDGLNIELGAQHCAVQSSGAFTGEVSASMLAALHTRYVIVGHSERRTLFAMDDEIVAATVRAVLAEQMSAIVCVGESAAQREQGETDAVVGSQVHKAVDGFDPSQLERVVVAYEPLWAIGSGNAATPEDALAAAGIIRAALTETFGTAVANATRVQYGGSANAQNAASFLSLDGIDGLLVGGASLEAATFCDILTAVAECYR